MSFATKIRTGLRANWNYMPNDLRGLLGMNEQLFRQARGARILVYHGICRTDHLRFNAIFLRMKTFEAHLRFFREYFHVVSLDQFYRQEFHKDRFNVCITFDDGFSNNYKYVLPLLNKYQAPAAFFVTAIRDAGYDILWNDFLAIVQKYGPAEIELMNDRYYKNRHQRYISFTNNKPLRDILQAEGFEKKEVMMKELEPLAPFKNRLADRDFWLQMTPEEIRWLSASPLATIGCHGYYHNDLSAIPAHYAREEMARSRQYLEQLTGKEIKALAFPYGAYSRQIISEANRTGFTQLLASDFLFPEDHTDKHMRERLTINPYISVNSQMTVIINGKY